MKRGHLSPLLLRIMEFKEQVISLLNQAFEKRPDLFLIDFSIGSDSHIEVVIDGDSGVTVEDCVEVSRAVEHNLDREVHDFSLSVQSAGATAPLTLARQFPKHIGRNLKVTVQNNSFEGELIEANPSQITLQWSERIPKEVGKGKQTVIRKEIIQLSDINKAHVVLTF